MLLGEHERKLHEWIPLTKEWKLIYNATRDGFRASDFHRMCDGKGENLGVIKSSNGFLFGWWTPLGWKSPSSWEYAADASTFIFTLTNPAGVSATYKNKQPQYALYHYAGYGPAFGHGCDIIVSDNSNSNTNSYTNFPRSYEDTTGRGNATFTGNRNFQLSELEVFVPV